MPSSTKPPAHAPASGRFVLRIPPRLHVELRRAAAEACLSLNEYCLRKLSAVPHQAVPDAENLFRRALELFGAGLVGLAVFGSWARGEATRRSDIDVLAVLSPRIPLKRELYRRFDELDLTWDSRRVEIHFAHFPSRRRLASGIWAEAAVDGIVVYERDWRLSRRLVEVRRDIAAGRIVRKTAGGQHYWTEVA